MPMVRVPSRTEALESKAVLDFGNSHYIGPRKHAQECLGAAWTCSDVMRRGQLCEVW